MLSRFFLNNSNKKMLAPHAVDIISVIIISSLIASLCFTIAELFVRTIVRQVKLCIGQRKYKQKFTTQGRKEGPTDRPSEWICARSLNSYFTFCKIVVKKGLLCNLGLLSQGLRFFQFDRRKTGHVRAKTCLTGQRAKRLPISYLQPWCCS